MLTHTLLLALAGAATATATFNPAHIDVIRREVQVQARQTDTGALSSCMAAMQSIITAMPSAPSDVAEFRATAVVTDPCNVSVPSSLRSVVSSYDRAVSSWYAANRDAWSSAMSECPGYAAATEGIEVPTCTAGASSDDDSDDDDDNDNNNDNNNNNSGNSRDDGSAGHRETALAGAAVAVAGFLGVVALL